MSKTTPIQLSDLLGLSRLAADGTAGVTNLVEAMHSTIAQAPGIFGEPAPGHTNGIPGLTYESVRAVTRLVGGMVDTVFTPFIPMLGERPSSPEREAVLAALYGIMGDYLAATDNPARHSHAPAPRRPAAKTRTAGSRRRDSSARQ